MYRMCNFVN